MTESVAATVTERTGVRWLPAYGASEVPVIAANPVDDPAEWRLDSAGLPPDGVELRIADLEHRGRPRAGGDRGDPGPQPVGHGRLPAGRGHGRRLRRRVVPHRRRRLAGARGMGPPDRPLQGDDQGQRLPGGAGRDRGGAPRPPGRARLRRVRRGRRAGRRGARGRGAARPGPAGGRRRAAAAGGRLAGHLQAAPPRRGGRRDPPPAVGQGAAPHAPRRVDAAARPPRPRRADGRPPLPRAGGPA